MISGPRSRLVVLSVFGVLSGGGSFARVPFRAGRAQSFTATAYSVKGGTATGDSTRRGTAAADPSVIPLGSKVRIRGAGKYSGVYLVKDTGAKVNGRQIDIYIPSEAAAKRFGKKNVTVEILKVAEPRP